MSHRPTTLPLLTRLTALASSALVLLLTILAASPQWHALLHAAEHAAHHAPAAAPTCPAGHHHSHGEPAPALPASDNDELCVITQFSQSQAALIDGLDVVAQPLETKRRLAYIPEQVNLYGYFSGVENLAYFSELAGHRYADAELRRFLTDAGLQAAAHDQRVSGYSKGMRQKVGIAIALAKKAKALLLDEPTSGLDPSAAHEFSALLKKLSGQGVAILMATHDLFRAKEIATRVGIMRHGKLAHILTAAELSHTDLEKLYLETMAA